jgi:23S rRNA (adenine2030-N6)-methyltransferase
MNYRHAYHAGNFADVFKHAVLCRVLAHLRAKPAAFRVIDTHAGAGLYDLAGPEASRSGEWRQGIARLLDASIAPDIRMLLAPYLDAVKALNAGGRLTIYPGSPALVRAWLRAQDRLVACELEPNTAAVLTRNLRGDRRVRVVAIDGWTALTAYVPPKERRGLVLVDPPFEQPDEFTRLADRLALAHRKWATGLYVLWYPIKDRRACESFGRQLARSSIGKILRAELLIENRADRLAVRPRPGQFALDAGRRADDPAVCARRGARAERCGQLSPGSAGARKIAVDHGPLCKAALFWYRRAELTCRLPEGGRRSDRGRLADAFPARECPAEPPRRGSWRRSNHGERSFPMAMSGTVKFFNGERGYGFIKPDDGGRDVFVHITAVERAGLKSLNEGQRISFEVEPDKKGKGPKAVNLVVTG